MSAIKCLIALLLGGLTGAVVYWVIAGIALLSMHGIPLGSAGGSPTAADLAVLLGGAVLAGGAGGWVTARLAPVRSLWLVVVLAVGLATFAYLGFSKSGSDWPVWFAGAFSLVVIAGAISGGVVSHLRKPRSTL